MRTTTRRSSLSFGSLGVTLAETSTHLLDVIGLGHCAPALGPIHRANDYNCTYLGLLPFPPTAILHGIRRAQAQGYAIVPKLSDSSVSDRADCVSALPRPRSGHP